MLSDVREWAFDQNARELEAHLKDRFDFTHFYVLDWVRGLQPLPELCRFDVIYCSYHPWGVELGVPWERTLGALCSQYFDPTQKHLPGPEEFAIVNRYRAFHTVERSNYEACRASCPQVHYITNPVDVTRFAPAPLSASPVVACWNGNAQHSNALHEDVKGFYSIVHPACKRAGVPLVFAEAGSCRKQPSEMPGFYAQANIAVCASLYEGACAVGSTPIVMSDGTTKRIDQVSVGDHVIARDGTVQTVERRWCEGVPEEITEITAWGGVRLHFTSNHRWPVWAWLRECLCGCGQPVKQGRLWVAKHAGSRGRVIRSVHVCGCRANRAASYRAIPEGYDPHRTLRSAELHPGDFLMIPRRYSVSETTATAQDARLLGYYVAEGSLLSGRCGDYGAEFAFAEAERDTWVADVLRLLHARGVDASVKTYAKKHSLRVRTKSPRAQWSLSAGDKHPPVEGATTTLVRWLREHAGEHAATKQLSVEVMHWPMELKRELLAGMFRGDGCQGWKRPTPRGGGGSSFSVRYFTVSSALAGQTQLLLAQLGYAAGVHVSAAHTSDLRHLGARDVSQSRELYSVGLSGSAACTLARSIWGDASKDLRHPVMQHRVQQPRTLACRVDDDFVYLPVTGVRTVPNVEPVYNLTVSGDHSYLANNVATYNSRSIMESMAAGLAVLATDCGNHREMQQSQLQEYGETGIRIAPRDVDAFASELARLRDDPELVAEMGRLNRAEIERAWSWPAWRERYAAFLSIPLETRVATSECSAEPEASTSVAASAVSLPVCELPPSTGQIAGVCSTPAGDLSSEVTVFFVTTGDPVAPTAWSALERQNCRFVLERIENVAPMSAAFQQMLVRCRTPYFVQVDEDMILKPGAIRTLYETMRCQPDDVFMYAYMLWDAHLVRGIFGVKVYRHALMRLVEYRDVQSCEQDHFKRLEALGYKYAVPGWSDATLTYGSPQVQGQHGTLYTPRAAFERYLDLTEKYRDVGGSDWYTRYPYEFLTRLLGEERLSAAGSLEQLTDFWALAGAVCGLFSDLSLPRKEKDFRLPPRGFGELRSHIVAPPQEGIIYSTSRCNGKCPHCSRTLTEHANVPDFTLALTRRMLKYYPSMRGVCIAGFGEPTLNEELPAIVGVLRERSIVVGVVTNGLRSVDAAGHLISGLAGASYVSFSLNATDREEHERMYGVADGWSRVTRGIEAACRAGVPPTLSFIVTKQTWRRIPEYLKTASSLLSGVFGARVALVNLLPHHRLDDKAAHADFLARTLSTSDDLSALSEYKSMACSLGLNVFVWPTPIDPDGPPRVSSCNSPFTRLGVDGAERVSPCSRITPPGEQFGQLTPSAWWASSGIRDLRRQIAGVLPLRWECRYCFGNYSSF
jgi:MoaA/NifB/PqqE/SkfB family radical SAM enzyme